MNNEKQSRKPVESVVITGDSLNLITVAEAARFLNLKISRIRNMVFLKEIPFLKLGASIRFDRVQLQSWIKTKMSPVE